MAAVDQRADGDQQAAQHQAMRFSLTTRQSLGQIPARVVAFGSLLIGARFLLSAGSVLSGQDPLVPLWLLAILCGYCLAVTLWVIVVGRAQAVLEPQGVWREGGRESAFVPWPDVVAVKQVRLLDARWVSLRRADGRRLWLPAPATSLFGPDPEFGRKIDSVREWWRQCGQMPARVSRGRRWRRRVPTAAVLVFAITWFTVQVLRYDIRPGREEVTALPNACAVLDGASAIRDVERIEPAHARDEGGAEEIERCVWDARRARPEARTDIGRLGVELRRYERTGPDSGPRRAAEDVDAYGGELLGRGQFPDLTDLADEAVITVDRTDSGRQVSLHVRKVNVVLDVQLASARRDSDQLTEGAVDVARTVLAWVEVG